MSTPSTTGPGTPPAAGSVVPATERPPIHVLTVKSDDALDQAEAFTAALRSALTRSPRWSLGDGVQSLEFLASKLGCGLPLDATCQGKVSEVLAAERYLWSEIKLADAGANVVGHLDLFVRGKGTSTVAVRFPATATKENALDETATTLLEKVTTATPTPFPVAPVPVPVPVATTPSTPFGTPLAPPPTVLHPGAPPTLLLGSPVFGPGAPPVGGPIAPPPARRFDWRFVAGAATAGLGLTSLVVMGVAYGETQHWQDDLGFNLYRAGVPVGQSACAAAADDVVIPGASKPSRVRSICNNASAWETTGVTTAVFGSVLLAGGGFLLVTSPTIWPRLTGKRAPWTSRLELAPVLTGETNGLLVQGRF